jgi:hypothetical protein
MVELDWTQEGKLSGIHRRMESLYWFLHVIMQMDRGYEVKDTKVVLGFIADKAHALADKVEKLLKKATIYHFEANDEVWQGGQHLVRMHHRQYELIRHTCKLAGIKLKVRYDMVDILNYTQKYEV